jgi:hypothetical protein
MLTHTELMLQHVDPNGEGFLSEMKRRHVKLAEDTAAYRQLVCQKLINVGITNVDADYDGYGDDGQLEQLRFSKGDAEIERGTIDNHRLPRKPKKEGYHYPDDLTEDVGLYEAVEDIFYDYLELKFAGWENNEGAFGKFVWELATDKLRLDHSERYTDVNVTEIDL